jgi:hypothetical protein
VIPQEAASEHGGGASWQNKGATHSLPAPSLPAENVEESQLQRDLLTTSGYPEGGKCLFVPANELLQQANFVSFYRSLKTLVHRTLSPRDDLSFRAEGEVEETASTRTLMATTKAAAFAVKAAAFVLGFALVAAALTAWLPAVRPQPIEAKLDWLAAHGERYDTFFIGSSRIYRQIIPELFDSEMERLGIQTKSFNLSADGMRPPEDELVLERAFRSRKSPVLFLVSECNPIDSGLSEEDSGTARAVHWHDTPRLMRLWRSCWTEAPSKPWTRRVPRILRRLRDFPVHAQHWILNCVRLGQGNAVLLERLFEPRPLDESKHVGAAGYRPPRNSEQMTGSVLRAYQKHFAAALKTPARLDTGDSESQAAIDWKKALAEGHGGELVLIASPFFRPEIFVPEKRAGIMLLDYSDPERYPSLYAPENRRDPGHLNVRGAEIYTRLVARQIAAGINPQK